MVWLLDFAGNEGGAYVKEKTRPHEKGTPLLLGMMGMHIFCSKHQKPTSNRHPRFDPSGDVGRSYLIEHLIQFLCLISFFFVNLEFTFDFSFIGDHR